MFFENVDAGDDGAMTMTVEVTVAKVVDMAVRQQGTDERGRWETHNNQLKLNDNECTRTTSMMMSTMTTRRTTIAPS